MDSSIEARDVLPESGHGWFCDPVQGLAYIDGLLFVTDSINYSEFDRVMPIVKEEQIAFCRLLANVVRAGDNVIDIGTGSGVFGIYAARRCGARVVCIDLAKRSCDFALNNATINSVEVSDSIGRLHDGQISVVHEELSRFCTSMPDANVFVLNPPFTPTVSDESVAFHARGGYDGQRALVYQLNLISRFLNPGDRIVGYQMACGCNSIRDFGDLVTETLRKPYSAMWTSAIRGGKTVSAEKFIGAIYGNRCGGKGSLRDCQITTRFFREKGVLSKEFAVIAYVITIRDSGVSEWVPYPKPLSPLGTWSDRVWLHARILDGKYSEFGPASRAFEV